MQDSTMGAVRIPDGGDRIPDGGDRFPDGLQDRLRERFGLPSFHPWQREAIDALLHGRRKVLVVAPTGGGKSLCYQLPATELPGTTLVVSPLIALMEDQVRGLTERGIPATWLSSTLDGSERAARMARMRAGLYKLVYVAPERLAQPGMIEFFAALRPPLVAIDEAHCISHWGHDFRPDYLRLRQVLDGLRPPHVLACTATATPFVREEILAQLGIDADQATVVLRGFARDNLHLTVREIDGMAARVRTADDALREALGDPAAPRGGGIVYGVTRRVSEQTAAALVDRGWRARAYHAGLEAREREEVNCSFASGSLDLVVATKAFGMGIDRADIRAVVHVQAPGSIEEYYQEVGRAGRDGLPAAGLLLSGSADFGLRRRLIELDGSREEHSDEQRAANRARHWALFLDLMRYVEAGSCRHDFILRYFGDDHELLGGCGHCDVCRQLAEGGGSRPGLSDDDALTVRKALAGVFRTRRRAGLHAVAEMLHGAQSERLRRMEMLHLRSHGALAEHPRPWIVALLRRTITAGLADLTPTDYPVPFLTPRGQAVMRGEAPVQLLLPPPEAGLARPPSARHGSPAPRPPNSTRPTSRCSRPCAPPALRWPASATSPPTASPPTAPCAKSPPTAPTPRWSSPRSTAWDRPSCSRSGSG